MSNLVKIDADFSKLENLDSFVLRHRERIEQAMAATIQTNRGLLFSNEGAYNGHQGWKKPQFRNGQALQDKGALRNSISPKVKNGDLVPVVGNGGYINYSGTAEDPEVAVGTHLNYAKIHTTGGTIKAKDGKALKIPIPAGKGAMFTEKRVRELNDELAKEKGVRRRASLQRRIDNAQAILYEAKQASSKKKKNAYLRKLANKIGDLKGSERRKVIKLANRVQAFRGNFIFRKSVYIPKRDFTEWNQLDQAEVENTLTNLLNHLLEVELGG